MNDPPVCHTCARALAGTPHHYRCAQCRVAAYCGRACQRAAWHAGGHQHVCAALQQLRATAEAGKAPLRVGMARKTTYYVQAPKQAYPRSPWPFTGTWYERAGRELFRAAMQARIDGGILPAAAARRRTTNQDTLDAYLQKAQTNLADPESRHAKLFARNRHYLVHEDDRDALDQLWHLITRAERTEWVRAAIEDAQEQEEGEESGAEDDAMSTSSSDDITPYDPVSDSEDDVDYRETPVLAPSRKRPRSASLNEFLEAYMAETKRRALEAAQRPAGTSPAEGPGASIIYDMLALIVGEAPRADIVRYAQINRYWRAEVGRYLLRTELLPSLVRALGRRGANASPGTLAEARAQWHAHEEQFHEDDGGRKPIGYHWPTLAEELDEHVLGAGLSYDEQEQALQAMRGEIIRALNHAAPAVDLFALYRRLVGRALSSSLLDPWFAITRAFTVLPKNKFKHILPTSTFWGTNAPEAEEEEEEASVPFLLSTNVAPIKERSFLDDDDDVVRYRRKRNSFAEKTLVVLMEDHLWFRPTSGHRVPRVENLPYEALSTRRIVAAAHQRLQSLDSEAVVRFLEQTPYEIAMPQLRRQLRAILYETLLRAAVEGDAPLERVVIFPGSLATVDWRARNRTEPALMWELPGVWSFLPSRELRQRLAQADA